MLTYFSMMVISCLCVAFRPAVVLVTPTATTCPQLDSLKQEINYLYTRDREQTLILIEEAYQLFDAPACPKLRADIIKMRGVMLYRTGKYVEAIAYFDESIQLCLDHNYLEGLANAYYNKGLAYHYMGDLERALEYALLSLEIDEQRGDEVGMGYDYNKIAETYLDLGEFEKALEFYHKGLALREKLDDTYGLAISYNGLGGLYYELRSMDTALMYYKQSAAMNAQLENTMGEASALSNIGNIYLYNGKYQEAKQMYESSITHFEAINDRINLASSLNALAYAYQRMEQYDSARYFGLMSLDTALQYNFAYVVVANYELLHTVEAFTNHYEKAYEYLYSFQKLRDSLVNESQVVKINDMRNQFELEKKEVELGQQRLVIESGEAANRNLLIGVVVLLVIAIVILALSWYLYRIRGILRMRNHKIAIQNKELNAINTALKRSESQLAQSNQLKDKFFSIIAHDLKAPLINLHTLMFIAKTLPEVQQSGEVGKQIHVLDEEILKVTALLDNLLYWALNQQTEMICKYEEVDVRDLVQETIELWEKYMENKGVRVELHIDGDTLIRTDKQMLYFVLRNLISNAVKFTHPNSKIGITCCREQQMLKISVSDQGVGMNLTQINELFVPGLNNSQEGTQKEKGTGIGLLLVREFLDKLAGEISVKSQQGKGSEFVIDIPVSPQTAA